MRCPYCGARDVRWERGVQGTREIIIFLVLLLFYIVPGLIYYFHLQGLPLCRSCGRRIRKENIPQMGEE